MMTWWRRWREQRALTSSMRHVDGIAFFMHLQVELVRKDRDGEWLAYAPEWHIATKGESAVIALERLWIAIQARNSLQTYLQE